MWNYRQSAEEELLDELINSILWRDEERWWKMSYNEARAIAEVCKDYGKWTVALKMRMVLATLWKVAYRNITSQSLAVLQENTKNDDEMDDIIQMALMVMLHLYRSQFVRLMKQWWIDPQPYVETFQKTQH